jgi:hypothetical protein
MRPGKAAVFFAFFLSFAITISAHAVGANDPVETASVPLSTASVTPSAQPATAALEFIAVTPCRVADTRNPTGPFGGPELAAGATREFNIPQGSCNIPTSAVAYSLNVTVVPNGSLNYLTLWPSGQAQPYVSTLNSDGRVKANAAITPAGTNGGVSVFVTDATQVILDIDGYFVPSGTASALQFFPVAPCRIADTRNAAGPLGGPFLEANTSRSFPVPSSDCGIPAGAGAYSLNVTAVPHGSLNYLTAWPTGATQPFVSTLNASTGAVTANAAIVPAGTSGAISVFVYDASDVILDVNGYFAPPAAGGLVMYTTTPCRALDTRLSSGIFNGVLPVAIESSTCAPPASAKSYVLNATVVPPGTLNYLSLWPQGATQPFVSTLNADDGAVTSNLAIVPTTNGSIDAFAYDPTQLILDLSGYFAEPLTITTTSPLPAGILGTAYVATLAASGGTSPYTWSVVSGTLPAGLVLSRTGVISGTPTSAGSTSFTVQATDASSSPQTATAALTLDIAVGPLAITTTSLPSGSQNTPYVSQLQASGGVPPYTWSLASGSALPAGLALSATGLISGTPTGVSSTTPTFKVTDSASDTTSKTLTLTINPASGTIPNGHYSFVFSGTAPQGTPSAQNGVAINGTFALESGVVTGGFFDENTNTNPALVEQPISGGSLTNGANGLGQLVLITAGGTMTFSLATPASVAPASDSAIRIIEFEDATGNGSRGSGELKSALANPTAAGISGSYAFLLSGTDIDQNQQALVCSFHTNGAGTVTNGKADANQLGGELASWGTLSGSYTVDANGRGVLSITLGGATFHYSFYQVSSAEWFAISLDPATLNSPLVSGSVEQQSGAPFSVASLPATSVLQISGVAHGASGVNPDITLGIATSAGNGEVNYSFDEYNGTLATGGTLAVTYAVDPTTGRAVSTGTKAEPILYIINSTSAFVLGADRSTSSGMLEAQTGSPFADDSFNGNYLGGSLPLVLTSTLNENGLVTADGAGHISFTTNRSSDSGLVLYKNVTGTYAVDTHGRVVVTTPDNLTRIFYIVSPTKVGYLTSDTGGYLGSFEK